MSEVLMQFAQHRDNDAIVDVASVTRGEACGCVCVSCGMTVVAKKGDLKAHHFAHLAKKDSRNTDCEYSFDVALRAMVRSLLQTIPTLLVPGIGSALPKPFTPDAVKIRANLGDNLFEAVLSKGEHQLCITMDRVFGYRTTPVKSSDPLRAVICLDPSAQVKSLLQRGNYRVILETWLTESTTNKHWLEHPRAPKQEPEQDLRSSSRAITPRKVERVDSNQGSSDAPSIPANLFLDGETIECAIHPYSWTSPGFCIHCGAGKTHLYARRVRVKN